MNYSEFSFCHFDWWRRLHDILFFHNSFLTDTAQESQNVWDARSADINTFHCAAVAHLWLCLLHQQSLSSENCYGDVMNHYNSCCSDWPMSVEYRCSWVWLLIRILGFWSIFYNVCKIKRKRLVPGWEDNSQTGDCNILCTNCHFYTFPEEPNLWGHFT